MDVLGSNLKRQVLKVNGVSVGVSAIVEAPYATQQAPRVVAIVPKTANSQIVLEPSRVKKVAVCFRSGTQPKQVTFPVRVAFSDSKLPLKRLHARARFLAKLVC